MPMEHKHATALSREFDNWLADAVSADAARRIGQITRWKDEPSVRFSHPREEHFPPLMVAAGAMLSPGIRQFRNSVLETAISGVAFA